MIRADIRTTVGSFDLAVDLAVDREITVLYGHSGAGKTLTLEASAGLLTPHEGRITLHDRVVFDSANGVDVPPQRRDLGYLVQSYALFPHLTVAQNIAYGLGHLRPFPAPRTRWSASRACSAWTTCCAAVRRESRAARPSAWPWRARSCASRGCCCWTSRSLPSTRATAAPCAGSSGSSRNGSISALSWSPTTSPRPTTWATGWRSSIAGACSRRARATRSSTVPPRRARRSCWGCRTSCPVGWWAPTVAASTSPPGSAGSRPDRPSTERGPNPDPRTDHVKLAVRAEQIILERPDRPSTERENRFQVTIVDEAAFRFLAHAGRPSRRRRARRANPRNRRPRAPLPGAQRPHPPRLAHPHPARGRARHRASKRSRPEYRAMFRESLR